MVIYDLCFAMNIWSSPLQHSAALTPSEHEGALAQAVVIVHVLGAEVCPVDY